MIFQGIVVSRVQIDAANERHAKLRLRELFEDRITQYQGPNNHSYKVIALVEECLVGYVEKAETNAWSPQRPEKYSTEESTEDSV
jgi:hypothetical protein